MSAMNKPRIKTEACSVWRWIHLSLNRPLLLLLLSLLAGPMRAPAAALAPDEALAAIQSGDVKTLQGLLAGGLPVSATNKFGAPLLGLAALAGHEPVVRLLLDQGASAATPSSRGALPLHFAAEGGNTNLLALFLEQGNPINATTGMGFTAFYFTVQSRHAPAARFLLAKGADPNLYTPSNSFPRFLRPLGQAINQQDKSLVELILKHGGDFNALDNLGNPTYFEAATQSSPAMLEFFLALGAEPDKVSREGSTPLMWAAAAGQLKSVQLLVSKGAQVDRRTRTLFGFGFEQPVSARDIALKNQHAAVVTFLERAGSASSKTRIHIIK